MKALLCTIPSDSHSWNLVFLDLFMRERGIDVKNLGVCTRIDDICEEMKNQTFDLIVVSSVNGHACIEAPMIIGALNKVFGLRCPPVVLGGKLGIRGKDNERHEGELLAQGFAQVYGEKPGDDGTHAFAQFLNALKNYQTSKAAYA